MVINSGEENKDTSWQTNTIPTLNLTTNTDNLESNINFIEYRLDDQGNKDWTNEQQNNRSNTNKKGWFTRWTDFLMKLCCNTEILDDVPPEQDITIEVQREEVSHVEHVGDNYAPLNR